MSSYQMLDTSLYCSNYYGITRCIRNMIDNYMISINMIEYLTINEFFFWKYDVTCERQSVARRRKYLPGGEQSAVTTAS